MTLLQEWMDANQVKEVAVAAALGIDRSQVWRLRNGLSRPSIDTAIKLEKLTTIPAGKFVMDKAAA